MKLKTKLLSALAPFIPVQFKIEFLHKSALQYYKEKECKKDINSLDILFDVPPKKKAENEIKKIVREKRVHEYFLRLLEIEGGI